MENISYKAQRDAKTVEEYLLKCLFQAEDERDAAIQEYQDKRDAVVKEYQDKSAKLDERKKKPDDAAILEGDGPHFSIVPTEGFTCNLETYGYRFSNIETLEGYRKLLEADDETLLEWARVGHNQGGWYVDCTPLDILDRSYGCYLAYPDGDDIRKFVSKKRYPEDFTRYIDTLTKDIRTDIKDYLDYNHVFDISLKDEVIKLALVELREVIKETIKQMEENG